MVGTLEKRFKKLKSKLQKPMKVLKDKRLKAKKVE